MEVRADQYNVVLRTNDDFTRSVSTPYDITTLTPKFFIKIGNTQTDWSSYITKTSGTTFTISVKASIIKAIGVGGGSYDCFVDFGSGSDDFLFGGRLTIVEGLS